VPAAHRPPPIRSTKQKAAGRWPKTKGQGALKKKVTDPYVVGWFLGGQKSTRVGQVFFEIFYRVFELPSPRNAQKRDKTKSRKERFGIFLSISFVKAFRHDFFVKRFL
jgi:hypothetical protein